MISRIIGNTESNGAIRASVVVVAGAAGGAIAIALMEWLSASAPFPLMFMPFATSIVLVMGMPEAAPAQPRALVGGHLVATLVGLIVVKLAGPGPRRWRSGCPWRQCGSPTPFTRRPASIRSSLWSTICRVASCWSPWRPAPVRSRGASGRLARTLVVRRAPLAFTSSSVP
jgi:hypothetical protein